MEELYVLLVAEASDFIWMIVPEESVSQVNQTTVQMGKGGDRWSARVVHAPWSTYMYTAATTLPLWPPMFPWVTPSTLWLVTYFGCFADIPALPCELAHWEMVSGNMYCQLVVRLDNALVCLH